MLPSLAYLSQLSGIGGTLKGSAGDFAVEEITEDGTLLELDKKQAGIEDTEGSFTHFILQKKDWNTLQALRAISKKLGISQKRFSYAGMKDRTSISTQLCSAFTLAPQKLLALNIKDIKINGAWLAQEKVKMGALSANRFTIIVRGIAENCEQAVADISKQNNSKFPNYFGGQRFGSLRANTHKVGEFIIRGDFKGAVNEYLCGISEGENEEARLARQDFASTNDYAQALKTFPHYLKYERTLLGYLQEFPTDYVNALRKLPRGLSLMFVHAFQSHIFNLVVSEGIRSGSTNAGTPTTTTANLVGYESAPTELEQQILASLSLAPENFKIKSFPEISSKGTTRPVLAELKDFSFKQEGENGIFKFILPAGSYATVALREFLDMHKNVQNKS